METEVKDTPDGQEQKPLEEKLEKLSKSVYKMSMMHGNALDMMYMQMITMVEILSEAKIITPEKWEAKLDEVAKSMEERVKETMNETGNNGSDNGKNTDGPDASTGSEKVITPNSGIIIP